jgi:hypothetical protein
MDKLNTRAALVANKARRGFRSAYAKAAAGGTALLASGMALAGGGATSPGAAIAAELGSGQTDVMSVVLILAGIVGLLILWAYVKRAR